MSASSHGAWQVFPHFSSSCELCELDSDTIRVFVTIRNRMDISPTFRNGNEVLSHFHLNSDLADVTIHIRSDHSEDNEHDAQSEVTVAAHSFVLCARSRYWRAMLTSQFKESQEKRVTLTASERVVKCVLAFVYKFEHAIPPSAEEVIECSYLAKQWGFDDYAATCDDWLAANLNPQTVCTRTRSAHSACACRVNECTRADFDSNDRMMQCESCSCMCVKRKSIKIGKSPHSAHKREREIASVCV